MFYLFFSSRLLTDTAIPKNWSTKDDRIVVYVSWLNNDVVNSLSDGT